MKKTDKIITRTLHSAAALQVREGDDGTTGRTITGYAILFDTPSVPLYDDGDEEIREVIAPEAVTGELLDGCDIKMTMFHDRQLILARSNKGAGTLSYTVDSRGVAFSFEAPNTADGDKALELVRRGDLSGCSFMFSTRYFDRSCVERTVERSGGKNIVTCRVKHIIGIYDFTLAADPAYPDTSCQARELTADLLEDREPEKKTKCEQVREMRRSSSRLPRI